jgi:hypothetical protein
MFVVELLLSPFVKKRFADKRVRVSQAEVHPQRDNGRMVIAQPADLRESEAVGESLI